MKKEKRKEYYLKNKEKLNIRSRQYFLENKEKIYLKRKQKKKQIDTRTEVIDEMINNFIKKRDYGEETVNLNKLITHRRYHNYIGTQ